MEAQARCIPKQLVGSRGACIAAIQKLSIPLLDMTLQCVHRDGECAARDCAMLHIQHYSEHVVCHL